MITGKFNFGKPLKQEIRDEISGFMQLKWQNNRNNFLLEQSDEALLDKLDHRT